MQNKFLPTIQSHFLYNAPNMRPSENEGRGASNTLGEGKRTLVVEATSITHITTKKHSIRRVKVGEKVNVKLNNKSYY